MLLLNLLLIFQSEAQVEFEDVSSLLGINITGPNNTKLGGVSFYDFDNDGWDDLTFACKGDFPVRFFKNIDGSYVEQDFSLNILGHSKQVIWVDYDNDGDNDLFVTKLDGANKLYQNNGSFSFTDVTISAGFTNDVLITYGVTFGDYNSDGYLDLFLSNKDDDKIIPNMLYKNNGNGTFTDVSASAGISSVGHLSFCAVFFDYNNDGHQDIYISNDRYAQNNILYKNNGNETFTDVSASSGAGIFANAMTTTIADYNSDGWFDIYVTNTSQGNFLLKNEGDGTFIDVATTTGTEFNSVGWGAVFLDVENDMDLDLYVSSMISDTSSGLLTSGFYICDENTEYTIPSNVGFDDDEYKSFGSAMGDFNNDGKPDFVVTNEAPDNHSLWRNKSVTSNNWIKIKLEGTVSNKNGIGNRIEIFSNGISQYRYTICGEGFLGQNSNYEFIGLSDATNIDYIKVTWNKTGIVETINNIQPNQSITIQEGNGVLSTYNEELTNFSIYPNPSENGIFKFTSGDAGAYFIEVFDISGRMVISKTQIENTINLSSLSKGIYLAKVNSDEKTKTIKLIKD
tara:strand:- start:4874 stop:6577 length:1704 start_codon:yes stop_codon:yes gene_type:complete